MSQTAYLRGLFAYPFMVNAFRAGTIVAVMAGTLGWFTVVRRQAFAAHTLALVGFPGAAAATLVGLPPATGYFATCVGAGVVVGAGPALRHSEGYGGESALIGSVQALLLACGFLFVNLYRGNLGGLSSLLFGNFLGITPGQVLALLVVALAAVAAVAWAARPLLFASVDPDAAAAAGVPVRALSILFLALLGAAAAEASQITGSLLVFALLILPAATAQAITPRPAASLALSLALAVAATWVGLAVAYWSSYPVGFLVTTFAFAPYVAARGVASVRARGWRRSGEAGLA